MKIEDVLKTYDSQYAAEYDETHLFGTWNRESIAFQLKVLSDELSRARNWLDVACGTGWVLSQFPNVQRAGLDLSGPMLEVARSKNPGVEFVQRNFRDPFPEWNDRFDVVSCMWWAYCLAETMTEIRELVARLADWTSAEGVVYLPLCNIQKFDRHNIRIPYIDPKVPGRLMITGIYWTWIQENGKRHDNALSPQLDYLIAMFREHFDVVEVVEGPLDLIGEGWRVQDVLLAREKRSSRQLGDLHGQLRVREPGRQEWLLYASEGSSARISYQTPDLESIRIDIDALGDVEAWAVQVSKRGFRLIEGREYRLTIGARAAAVRPVALGVGLAHDPWSGLGFYETLVLTPEWQRLEFSFLATAASDMARVHIDLGGSYESVELADLSLTST